MKRSNSWKNLQRTFASTPVSVKRTKINRKNVDHSKSSSIDENNSFQIEDSDEENVSCAKIDRTPLKTPMKSYSKHKASIPLLINTSINVSKTTDSSFAWNSDSGESVDGEPELRDVFMCKTNTRNLKKARSKSLLFLTKDEQNQSISSINERTTLKDITPTKQQQSKTNHKHGFNNTILNRRQRNRPDNNDGTISESDSLDDSQSPSKQNQNSMENEVIKRQHSADIFFTQTTNSAPVPVIESESSQSSLSLKSQQPVPNKRNKNKKHLKGGLVERLKKLMNSSKSDFSFWMNERTSDLIEPGGKLRIDKIEQSYGRVLLHCSSGDDKPNHSNKEYILCVDPSFKKLTMLQIGKTIEVCFDTNGYRTVNGPIFYPNVTKILV